MRVLVRAAGGGQLTSDTTTQALDTGRPGGTDRIRPAV